MKTLEVVAAIIMDGEKILATQRGYGDFKGGWEFPGGKVEPNESPERAVVREIREELSATIEVDSFVCTVEYDYPKFHLTMHCFMCHVVSGHIQLVEHEDARWLLKSELRSLHWLPADVDVVEKILAQSALE